jgi:hypothetical protein
MQVHGKVFSCYVYLITFCLTVVTEFADLGHAFAEATRGRPRSIQQRMDSLFKQGGSQSPASTPPGVVGAGAGSVLPASEFLSPPSAFERQQLAGSCTTAVSSFPAATLDSTPVSRDTGIPAAGDATTSGIPHTSPPTPQADGTNLYI